MKGYLELPQSEMVKDLIPLIDGGRFSITVGETVRECLILKVDIASANPDEEVWYSVTFAEVPPR